MSRQSDSRRQRRALKAAGVAMLDRVTLDDGALAAAVTKGANLTDLVAYHVSEALTRLDASGADIIGGTVAVTIGRHPDYPGGVTVEAKADTRKPTVPGGPPLVLRMDPALDDGDDESDGGLIAEP